MDDFIRWHEARVLRRTGRLPAASTLRSTRTRLRSALRCAETLELSVLADICQRADDSEILLDRLALTNSPGSLRLVYEALKTFVVYAKAKGWSDGTLAMDPPSKNAQKPISVYHAREVEALIGSAAGRSLRWWAFLSTLAHTGRRIGETLSIEWEHFHLDTEVPHYEIPNPKNQRQAYVPLDRFLLEEVFTDAHMKELQTAPRGRFTRDPADFPFPWSYNCAEKMFRRHCKVVGVPHRGFHCLRHTRATELLTRGVPIQAVSALLGHASVATTDRIYNHATALSYGQYLDPKE